MAYISEDTFPHESEIVNGQYNIVLFLLCGSVVHNLSLSVSLPSLANKRVHNNFSCHNESEGVF